MSRGPARRRADRSVGRSHAPLASTSTCANSGELRAQTGRVDADGACVGFTSRPTSNGLPGDTHAPARAASTKLPGQRTRADDPVGRHRNAWGRPGRGHGPSRPRRPLRPADSLRGRQTHRRARSARLFCAVGPCVTARRLTGWPSGRWGREGRAPGPDGPTRDTRPHAFTTLSCELAASNSGRLQWRP